MEINTKLFQGAQVVTSNATSLMFNTQLLQQNRRAVAPPMPGSSQMPGYNQMPAGFNQMPSYNVNAMPIQNPNSGFAMNRATVVPTNTPYNVPGYAPQMPMDPRQAPPMPGMPMAYGPYTPQPMHTQVQMQVPMQQMPMQQMPMQQMQMQQMPMQQVQQVQVPIQPTIVPPVQVQVQPGVPTILPAFIPSGTKVVPTNTLTYDEY
jgi:hypothetical protein